jgi:hypothetical protein
MRILATTATVIVLVICWRFIASMDSLFLRGDFFSGYALGIVCVLLFALSLRKRLLPLAIGRVAIWQQMHHYLGIYALGMFVLHAPLPIYGWLECLLAATFLGISFSGILGWYLNWSTPRKLNSIPREVPLERFATVAGSIADRAYALALQSAGQTQNVSLAELYRHRLIPFFQGRRSLAYVLIPTGSARRRTLSELTHLDRYLAAEGRLARQQMSQLVVEKDDLDYQTALQLRMRWWVIGHVSLTWVFVVLAIVHVILVHQFADGS